MKNTFGLFSLFIFMPLSGFCWLGRDTVKESKFEVSIRFNTNFSFSRYMERPGTSIIQFGYPSASCVFFNKQKFVSHEIDLSSLLTSVYNPGKEYKANRFTYTLMYQYSYSLLKKKSYLLIPYLGFSLTSNLDKDQRKWENNNGKFERERLRIESGFNMVVGFKSYLSQRVYVDFSLPINVFSHSFYETIQKDSSVKWINDRSESDFFPWGKNRNYKARIGIGIIINSEEDEEFEDEFEKTIRFNWSLEKGIQREISFFNTSTSFSKEMPSVAFRRKEEGALMHEISIPDIKLYNTNTYPGIATGFWVNCRYQVSYLFGKRENRFVPYLGLSFQSYFNTSKYKSSNTDDYSNSGISLKAYVNPGVQYQVTKKMYLDLGLPVPFAYWICSWSSNEALYAGFQNYRFSLYGRLGMGIRL